MTSERIKEIQEQTPYPQSVSVMLALKQVWNECEQDNDKYTAKEVELVAFAMVNWALDNIDNPNPESGKKFDEVLAKYKNK